MVAAVSNPVLQVLPDLPRDVSSPARWGLIAGVVVAHVVVATLVVLTSRLPAVVADAAPISVSLLTQAPSGEWVPAKPPVVQPRQTPAPVSRAVTPSLTPVTLVPQVAAVAAPAQANDRVVPVAPAVMDRKIAVDEPVTQTVSTAPVVTAASGAADAATSVASTQPVQLSHTPGRYLNKVKPLFPPMSARLGEYGSVTVSVVVDDHGLPVSAAVARSSGYPRLDAAARNAAMQSRYVPYMLNGVPQRYEMQAPFSFVPPTE